MNALGSHLIADLFGCARLDEPPHIEAALRNAVIASGATLLYLQLHHFGPKQGVTGVALLAESHISVHSWPERGLAAIDIFMCGSSDARAALNSILASLSPAEHRLIEVKRGCA
jgi:S-adenosylmethionine decarboxylase